MQMSSSLLLEVETAYTLQILFEVYRPLFVLTHNYPQALHYLSHRSCQGDVKTSSVHTFSSFPFELTECLKEEREYLLESYSSQANALAGRLVEFQSEAQWMWEFTLSSGEDIAAMMMELLYA